jgi:hypothetical protein
MELERKFIDTIELDDWEIETDGGWSDISAIGKTIEYDEWVTKPNLKNYEIKYKKGLAALVGDEYNDIINNPKITLITSDDFSEKSLEMWFGKDTKLRKEELLK